MGAADFALQWTQVAAELEFQREAAAVAAVAAAAAEGPVRNGGSGHGGGGGGAASAGTGVVAALPGSWGSVRRDGAFWMPWQVRVGGLGWAGGGYVPVPNERRGWGGSMRQWG